jgi:hypothetical protein
MLFTCSRCRGSSSVWKSDHRTGHVQHRLWVYCPTGSCHQVAATEIDSTDILIGRASVNQKSVQVFLRWQIECVNKTVWICLDFGHIVKYTVIIMSQFWKRNNDLVLTYTGNLCLLSLIICTLWGIWSQQVNLLSAYEWMRLFLAEKMSDRNA